MNTILAIDDNPDNLSALEVILQENLVNYRLITALSGAEGIEVSQKEKPDVILLDIRMPRMDGYETCRRLKSSPLTRHIPIIMLTAMQAGSEEISKGLEFGADAFLPKPIDSIELIAQIKVALRIKRSEDELKQRQQDLESIVYERTKKLVEANLKLKEEIRERKNTEQELRKSETVLRELSMHIQEVQEREQSRIARELHDELGQLLTALKMELVQLKKKALSEPDRIVQRTDSAINIAEKSIRSVQEISGKLRSEIVVNLGLDEALRSYIDKYQSYSEITCQLQFKDMPKNLGPSVATSIFRLIQEALTNVLRHAHASRVVLDIRRNSDMLKIKIEDDGIGIPEDRMEDIRSFGLIGMRERAKSLGGQLKIHSNKEEGTRIKVSIPLTSSLNTE